MRPRARPAAAWHTGVMRLAVVGLGVIVVAVAVYIFLDTPDPPPAVSDAGVAESITEEPDAGTAVADLGDPVPAGELEEIHALMEELAGEIGDPSVGAETEEVAQAAEPEVAPPEDEPPQPVDDRDDPHATENVGPTTSEEQIRRSIVRWTRSLEMVDRLLASLDERLPTVTDPAAIERMQTQRARLVTRQTAIATGLEDLRSRAEPTSPQ